MKKLLFIILFSQLSLCQTNEEIVSWLNTFEDNNSPERIMKGTLEDKVFLVYNNGLLVINSMAYGPLKFNGESPIYKYRCIINIADITQIEGIERQIEDYVFYDIKICTKQSTNSLNILRMKDDESNFNRLPFLAYEKYVEKFGSCWAELRFKFPKNIAKDQLSRIYKAFSQLAKNHNTNPKIGSYF